MNFFEKDTRTAYEAMGEAQRIAFAPVVFQACRILRDSGILEEVRACGSTGINLTDVAARISLPRYGIKILLEAGLGIGLFCLNEGRYSLTKLGYFILSDEMTRVNMGVMHDVCYRGFYELDKSLQEGRPAGLKALGDWKTLYEGLSSFPSTARESWLRFDHFYSDKAFPAALPVVFARRPKRILDVGGNTGRWAVQCVQHDPDVRVTIADLPQQLELAREAIRGHEFAERIAFHAIDVLDDAQPFPPGHDAIWMSQFLDCFSEQQIVSILKRAARAISEESTLFILELFWDRQPNDVAAFCLQQTSLYFACIANGNSQMYHSADLLRCLVDAGFAVREQSDQVGRYHTLLQCRRTSKSRGAQAPA
jgi:ubiquinone/menaquinone biosynthesis C-methylase UbiE